jgi:hypothetical protein
MDIEWARNIGAVILFAGAFILSISIGSTDIKSWEDKNGGYVGHEEDVKNKAIAFRIAAIFFVVLLVFVGVALVH